VPANKKVAMPSGGSNKRGAATLQPSPSKRLQELDRHASELERELSVLEAQQQAAAATKNNKKGGSAAAAAEEKANQLRVRLCEALCDVILKDAEFAVRRNCAERLWRRCFYPRVQDLRRRVARDEKIRLKQAAKEGVLPSSATPTSSRRGGSGNAELALMGFLSEAVTMYDFLIGRLCRKLSVAIGRQHDRDVRALMSQQSQSSHTTASGASTTEGGNDTDASAANGIVECVARLEICLGDLNRYSGANTSKAENCYRIAATLGPGFGHAYNQLGVLCQQPKNESSQTSPPPVAVTLYWYARALSVKWHPSPGTRPNMQRLLKQNRQWLLSRRQEQHQNTQSGAPAMPTMSKSDQTRLFLSQFVDLQSHFVNGVQEKPADFERQLGDVTTALRSLLDQSALGDALLCKLVAILAFSECYKDRELLCRPNAIDVTAPEKEKNPRNIKRISRLTWTLARSSSFAVGTALCDRVIALLSKLTTGDSDSNRNSGSGGNNDRPPKVLPPSVRILLPLLLMTEYLHSHPDFPLPSSSAESNGSLDADRMDTDDYNDDYENDVPLGELYNTYWSKVVQALNMLSFIGSHFAIPVDASKLDDLKEYRELRGFTPFESFIRQDGIVESTGFLDNHEALDAMVRSAPAAAIPSSQQESSSNRMTMTSQESSVGTIHSSGSAINAPEQGRIKVARFLLLGDRLLSDTSSELGRCIVHRDGDDRFVWIPNNGNRQTGVFDESEFEQNPFAMDDDDGNDGEAAADPFSMQADENSKPAAASATDSGGNTSFVYKQDASSGAALLVPSALLQQQQQLSAVAVPSGTATAACSEDRALSSGNALLSPAMPGIMPPTAHPSLVSLGDQLPTSHIPVVPPPGFGSAGASASGPALMPAVGTPLPNVILPEISHQGYPPPGMAPSPTNLQTGPGGSTVLDSFQMLDRYPPWGSTANPFAQPNDLEVPGGPISDQTAPARESRFDATHLFVNGRDAPTSMFDNQSFHGNGETLLLGSELLNIMSNDGNTPRTKSRNPFAT